MKKVLLLPLVISGFLISSAQPAGDVTPDSTLAEKVELLAVIIKKQDQELQMLKRMNAELKLEINSLRAGKPDVRRTRKPVVERRGSKQVTVQ